MRAIRAALIATAAVAAFCLALAVPHAADAWFGDFFDGGASGQAVYEDMAIHPQAVRVGDTVYVAYQGANLDPYLVAFPDAGGVDGPYRIGTNPLGTGWDPDDSHGAPSLLADTENGVLNVFWGAHGTKLMQGRAEVSNLTSWTVGAWTNATDNAALANAVTYPQVVKDPDGTAHLFFRRDADGAVPRGSWLHASSVDGGATWSLDTTPVVVGSDKVSWYAHFEPGDEGRIHLVMTSLLVGDTAYRRSGVYYLYRDAADGAWKDVNATSLDTTGVAGVELKELEATGTASTVASAAPSTSTAGPFHNQVTCADDGSGGVGLLFLTGNGGYGPTSHKWKFARFTGSAWTSTTVTTTDHFMDSSTLEYGPDGIDAFVTAGGTRGTGSAADPYSDRGGDIRWYRSTNGGATWTLQRTIATSDPDRDVIYNDPQIVEGHESDPDGPRVLYGEWNNDAGNFVHKVYLWGESGYRGKEFFPDMTRLAGPSRYEAAVSVSQQGFPRGSDYAVVASGEAFADALAGVTLAYAYDAPLLLISSSTVPTAVADELKRLDTENIFVLGGEKTITEETRKKLYVTGVKSVARIGGADRYAVASSIALKVAEKRGTSADHAYVVSGEVFPDALSAAPLAAAQGAPLLLVSKGGVPDATYQVIGALDIQHSIIVGGEASVGTTAAAGLPEPFRVAGPDRYTTSAKLADLALSGDSSLGIAPSLKMDRFIVASGEVFPDALSGGALAARVRGPVVLTQSAQLPAATQDLLARRAFRVLHTYVVGGEKTITTSTVSAIADMLRERQDD